MTLPWPDESSNEIWCLLSFPQVCLNYECVSANLLKYDCDTQQKCHGHGVRASAQNTPLSFSVNPVFCSKRWLYLNLNDCYGFWTLSVGPAPSSVGVQQQ